MPDHLVERESADGIDLKAQPCFACRLQHDLRDLLGLRRRDDITGFAGRKFQERRQGFQPVEEVRSQRRHDPDQSAFGQRLQDRHKRFPLGLANAIKREDFLELIDHQEQASLAEFGELGRFAGRREPLPDGELRLRGRGAQQFGESSAVAIQRDQFGKRSLRQDGIGEQRHEIGAL